MEINSNLFSRLFDFVLHSNSMFRQLLRVTENTVKPKRQHKNSEKPRKNDKK